jgi:hypothetical protein
MYKGLMEASRETKEGQIYTTKITTHYKVPIVKISPIPLKEVKLLPGNLTIESSFLLINLKEVNNELKLRK